ncbi:DUF3726 domain-containing protein [Grimontia sp. NTOU-MAR1]|uniref:DUF3726 domain-containing protein n=1 Tax=Grimontia sp. NTOU-MAR1 TaxID=3111011 RepID=UPI002DBABF63|nr:DUF3726 domain-containing protein [Grimontia sp. NTOU-MAR1]WRV99663.1 DUF3726 domain-containing protein [Grimontia sp. NTOU-MAR1]
MIRVSHNELVGLCTKAFDALNHPHGESDTIADTVVDLEMAGLGGVSMFVEALPTLDGEQQARSPLCDITDGNILVNLHGGSLFCHLPALIDVAVERLIYFPEVSMAVWDCRNRWLAFGELLKLAGKGLSVRVCWHRSDSPDDIECILNAGSRYPDIYLQKDLNLVENSMQIELSLTPFTASNSEASPTIAGSVQSEAVNSAWEQGISIRLNDWELLKHYASRLLVEDSDRSMRGAGE